jgi:hypothetical protein
LEGKTVHDLKKSSLNCSELAFLDITRTVQKRGGCTPGHVTKEGLLAIVEICYSDRRVLNYSKGKDYWLNLINNQFAMAKTKSGHQYIHPANRKAGLKIAWVVRLPRHMKPDTLTNISTSLLTVAPLRP